MKFLKEEIKGVAIEKLNNPMRDNTITPNEVSDKLDTSVNRVAEGMRQLRCLKRIDELGHTRFEIVDTQYKINK